MSDHDQLSLLLGIGFLGIAGLLLVILATIVGIGTLIEARLPKGEEEE